MKKVYLVFAFIIIFFTILLAIELNQWDNFQDSTTQGWQTGAPNPNPPLVVTDGGPEGDGDAYLLLTANGGTSAPGGRLIVYNNAQWTGNYTGAGIHMISMHMNNFGTSDLSMRIALQGQDDYFWSVNPVLVPAQSGWVIAKFSVLPEDLKTGAGGGDVSATLSNVVALRIFRRVDGNDFRADPITTQLGIDDITAAEDPLPAEFIAFNAVVQGGSVNLLWRTASEINN